MKKYEVLAIVIMILYVIASIPSPLHTMLLNKFYGPKVVGSLTFHLYALVFLQGILRSLVAIAIAVWLGYQAKKDGCSVPIWALFGLAFSIIGAILYFVLRNHVDPAIQAGERKSY